MKLQTLEGDVHQKQDKTVPLKNLHYRVVPLPLPHNKHGINHLLSKGTLAFIMFAFGEVHSPKNKAPKVIIGSFIFAKPRGKLTLLVRAPKNYVCTNMSS